MKTLTRLLPLTVAGLLLLASSAHAQSYQTWVSGVGDDANPCTRTAPCKTFAGAISRTTAGGEISVLDPGGFGAVTITKAITINGVGNHASILASGTSAIIINAGTTDTVVLRNLSMNGGTTVSGVDGVRLLQAGRLVVEDCEIAGFDDAGIEVATSTATKVVVSGTTIRGITNGVKVAPSAGRADVLIDNATIRSAATGIEATGGYTMVSRSTIAGNTSFGVRAQAAMVAIDDTTLTGNGVAVQSDTGATVRLSGTSLFNNLTGFGCGAGPLLTTGTNRKGGNTGGPAACDPTGTVTVQ